MKTIKSSKRSLFKKITDILFVILLIVILFTYDFNISELIISTTAIVLGMLAIILFIAIISKYMNKKEKK